MTDKKDDNNAGWTGMAKPVFGINHNPFRSGDSLVDAIAGRDAGLQVIAVNYGYNSKPVESLEANSVIDNFALLPQTIATLNSLR